MTTFTTEDRINASPPHIVDSGASVIEMNKKELADGLNIGDALNIADHLSQGYLDWCPEAEWVLRAQHSRIKELEADNAELKEYNTELHGIEHDLEMKVSQLEAKIDEMAGEIMSLENKIGTMTGYGHN